MLDAIGLATHRIFKQDPYLRKAVPQRLRGQRGQLWRPRLVRPACPPLTLRRLHVATEEAIQLIDIASSVPMPVTCAMRCRTATRRYAGWSNATAPKSCWSLVPPIRLIRVACVKWLRALGREKHTCWAWRPSSTPPGFAMQSGLV
jgi:hypothetical protein